MKKTKSVESTSKKSKVQPVTEEGELLETEDDPDVSMLLSEAEEGKLMNVDLIKKLSKEVASELVKSSKYVQNQMILQQTEDQVFQQPGQQIVSIPEQQTDLPVIKPGSIESVLSERGLTFLPSRQPSATITTATMPQSQPTVMNFPTDATTIPLSQATLMNIPSAITSVADTSTVDFGNLVMPQQTEMMTTSATSLPVGEQRVKVVVIEQPAQSRTSTKGPVPENQQDPRRHYCDVCPCNYSRKDLLSHHKKYNCLVSEKQFICDVCNAAFKEKDSLRMHYYRDHLKTFLYFCKKCNKGFMYKSRLSGHKNACPNKEGDEIYPGKAPVDPELEKKFVRRKAITVDADVQKALDILEEQNRCDAEGSEYPQAMETKPINLDPGQVPQQYPQQAEMNPD